MVIQKVHGLHATSISLNDRFTMLASASVFSERVAIKPMRHHPPANLFTQNLNFRNRNLIEEIVKRLEQQTERIALRKRLGFTGGLRRFGSESSLPGLRRSNSFGNLSHRSFQSRGNWQYNNGGMRRSASFADLYGDHWQGKQTRGFRWWGGGQRPSRRRFRRKRANNGWLTRVENWAKPGQQAKRANTQRGRGGNTQNQPMKPVPTKEQLDKELDEYMASSVWALDKELDTYMKEAVEIE